MKYRSVKLVVTSFLLAGCVQSTARQSNPEEDWLFGLSTQWTYNNLTKSGQEKTGSFTERVTKIENGICYLDYGNGEAAGNSLLPIEGVQWIADGGWCSASILDGKILSGQKLYKLGSKKGDTWVYDPGVLTATNEGVVAVKVPAGTYNEAIQIKVTNDGTGQVAHRIWLVPKVGLVKLTTDPDLSPMTMELEKFEPSK